MLAIGFDYGSTNSLVVNFETKMEGSVTRTHLKSEVKLCNEYIRSPKRLLHNIECISEEEIKKIQDCIRICTRNILTKHLSRTNTNIDGLHIAITIPNAFKDRECSILKKIITEDASDIFCGDDIELPQIETSLIPEPVAAALYFAYCMNKNCCLQKEQYVIVSDIGGGTTDLAIVRVLSAHSCLEFEVIHTEHMFNLGGNDIDNAIADYFITKRPELRNISRDIVVRACCELKVGLSLYGGKDWSEVDVLDDNADIVKINDEEVTLGITKDELREVLSVNNGFLTKYRTLAERLENKLSKIDSKGCTYLLPVGGTSRLSLVRETLKEVFKQYKYHEAELNTEKLQIETTDGGHYDSVVRGAAIYAAYNIGLLEQNIVIKNRTMHRISLCYGNDRLHECVMQCSSDGVYECRCRCEAIHLNSKEGWFKIGTIRLYQGGKSNYLDNDCVSLKEKDIDEKLYLNGRKLEDIGIVLRLEIIGGRLQSVEIRAEGCRKDGSDFVTRLAYDI